MQTQHTLTGSDRTDEALLQAVREGNLESFGDLYERYYPRARAIAAGHTGDQDRLDDMVSEAFARILQALKNGKGPRSYMGAYLATTIAHLAGEYGMLAEREIPSQADHMESMESLDETVLKLHGSAEAITAFTSLPERWQKVLWLTEIEAKKPREVAADMNLTANAVSALAVRARESLKEGFLRAHQSSPATADCDRYHAYISPYVRGSLSAKRAQALQAHMEDCRYCTTDYLSLAGINKSMRSWIFPVLAGLTVFSTDGAALLSPASLAAAGLGTASVAAGASSQAAAGTGFSLLSPKSWGGASKVMAGAAAATTAAVAVAGGVFFTDAQRERTSVSDKEEQSSVTEQVQDKKTSASSVPQQTPSQALGAEYNKFTDTTWMNEQAALAGIASPSSSAEDQQPGQDIPLASSPTPGAATSSLAEASATSTDAVLLDPTGAASPSHLMVGEMDPSPLINRTDPADGSGQTSSQEAAAEPVQSLVSTEFRSVEPSQPSPTSQPSRGAEPSQTLNPSPSTQPSPSLSPSSSEAQPKMTQPAASPEPSQSAPQQADPVKVPGWYGSQTFMDWLASIPWNDFGRPSSEVASNRLCWISYYSADGRYQELASYYLPAVFLDSPYTRYTLAGIMGWQQAISIQCQQ